MTDTTRGAGRRPPKPVTHPDVPPTAQPVENAVPGTAGAVDPLAKVNATLPLNKTRADFRPGEFDRTILQHGKKVIWRKAMLCPCVRKSTDQIDLACTDCDSSGYFYVDPLEISALMMQFSENTRLYEKFGLWVSGETSVTTQAPYRLAYRDSLEMVDDLMNFNELLTKADRRGRRKNLPVGTDAGRYRMSQLTKALVRLNNKNVALEMGIHLTLNDQGHIQWLPAGEELVPDETIVSVHYDFHPVFVVISHPHALRSDVIGTKRPTSEATGLPLQAAAQLDYLQDPAEILPVTGAC